MRGHGLGAAFVLACLASATPARATELGFDAPAECGVTREDLEQQIEHVIARPLSAAESALFDVRVRRAGRAWLLVLSTREAAGSAAPEAGAREIRGASCHEVTDAAAVAIALAVEGKQAPASERQDWEPRPAQTAPAAPSGDAETARHSDVVPAEESPLREPRAQAENAVRFGLFAAAQVDGSALPHATPGASLGLLLEFAAFRAEVFGTLFLPQTAALSDGRGGEFDLFLSGARACGQSAFGDLRVLGCASFEAGRLSGRGLRVRSAYTRNTAWFALGVEAGLLWLVSPKVGLMLRGGLARPLSRPDFVLDGMEPVHRAGAVSLRGMLGGEIYL
jgi:hypothetical protein